MAYDLGAIVSHMELELSGWKRAIEEVKKDERSLRGMILRHDEEIRRIGYGMTVVGAGILGVSGYMTKVAMDAEETANLFNVALGEMAQEAAGWTREVSRSLGLYEVEVQRNLSSFYAMTSAMGLSGDAAYEMSTSLTQLTYDMSSLFNLEFDDAFTKLAAGLSGEVEPLKRLGVIVNENTTKQWALRNGLIEQGQVMSEQQKVVARYAVMMEQLSIAHGDLERTADSATNQFRRLQSQAMRVASELGEALLPVANDLLHVANDMGTGLAEWIRENEELTRNLVIAAAGLGAVAAAAGPVLIVLPGIATAATVIGPAVAALAGPIGVAAAAVVGLSAAGVYLYETNELARREFEEMAGELGDFRDALFDVGREMMATAGHFGDAIREFNAPLADALGTAVTTSNAVKMVFDAVTLNIRAITGASVGGMRLLLAEAKAVAQMGRGEFSAAWETLKTGPGEALDAARAFMPSLNYGEETARRETAEASGENEARQRTRTTLDELRRWYEELRNEQNRNQRRVTLDSLGIPQRSEILERIGDLTALREEITSVASIDYGALHALDAELRDAGDALGATGMRLSDAVHEWNSKPFSLITNEEVKRIEDVSAWWTQIRDQGLSAPSIFDTEKDGGQFSPLPNDYAITVRAQADEIAAVIRDTVGGAWQSVYELAERGAVEMRRYIISDWSNAFRTFYDDLMDGSTSFADDLRALFDNLFAGIVNAYVDMLSQMAAQQLFNFTFGGIGDFKVGSANGGWKYKFAEGGMIDGHLTPVPSAAYGGLFARPTLALVGDSPSGPERVLNGAETRAYEAGLYQSGKRSASDSAPASVEIHVHNESGVPVSARQTTRMDGKRQIVDVVLEAMQTNPGFRSAVKGVARG